MPLAASQIRLLTCDMQHPSDDGAAIQVTRDRIDRPPRV
jgi:hypothetical protein